MLSNISASPGGKDRREWESRKMKDNRLGQRTVHKKLLADTQPYEAAGCLVVDYDQKTQTRIFIISIKRVLSPAPEGEVCAIMLSPIKQMMLPCRGGGRLRMSLGSGPSGACSALQRQHTGPCRIA